MATFKKGHLEMDAQTLLNELVAGGFRIEPQGEALAVHGPVERLTDEHKQSLRQYKQALHQLATCIPVSEVGPEYEALSRALADWDELPEPPENCPQCGEMRTWWDVLGNPRCRNCDANQSDRLRALAKRCRDKRERDYVCDRYRQAVPARAANRE
jgi:hypothetical protein